MPKGHEQASVRHATEAFANKIYRELSCFEQGVFFDDQSCKPSGFKQDAFLDERLNAKRIHMPSSIVSCDYISITYAATLQCSQLRQIPPEILTHFPKMPPHARKTCPTAKAYPKHHHRAHRHYCMLTDHIKHHTRSLPLHNVLA